MASIAYLDPSAAQAAQAGGAGAEAGNATAAQPEAARLVLPPASLAGAAAANTVNAELATSQWGVDPASVGGVYGGSSPASAVLGGGSLLPLLQSLSNATAERALALIGIHSPRSGSTSTNAAAAARAAAAANSGALFGAASADSTPVVVDPLWGREA